jgi:hypothetical protein
VYAEIRKYRTNSPDEATRRAEEGFVPILKSHPGFLAYYILKEGNDVVATITMFETQREARESNKLAAGWVKQNIATLVAGPPEITEGEVVVQHVKDC